ncbi:unnamed protein product [Acanthoscelides obtectus]|nr:unnamed protein product [Acanthoscelides obtectus]CAK1657106.1 Protein rolling stone [Acanthoscelides obtectus]
MLLASYVSTKAGDRCLKMYPVYWLTNTIATPIAFLITALFWCAVYEPELFPIDVNLYFVHANNSLVMLIDSFMVSHPFKWAHLIYPILFGGIYATFTVVYYFAGGKTAKGEPYIYKVLDWSKPSTASFITIGAFGLVLVTYALSYLLCKTRTKIHNKYCATQEDME